MNEPCKVLLIEEDHAAPSATAMLDEALRGLGAQVRRLPLAPPYDAVLDALADGWLPVLMRAPPDAEPAP